MFNKIRFGQHLFLILPKIRSLTRLLLICLPLTSLLLMSPALAQVPKFIRYQGQVVDSRGVPLEGPYTLHFRLYDAETAGNMVWDETQTSIPITKGQFSVLLGQVTSLATADWGQPRWLSVQVNGDPELAPRQQITSVPLAIRAETAEIVKTSGLTDDANRLVPSGAIVLWAGSACPASYTRMSALDGKFLVGGSGYNAAAGGSNTHTHGVGTYASQSHTHSVPYNGWTSNGSGTDMSILSMGKSGEAYGRPTTNNVSGSGGGLPITGTSGTADSRPEFATVLLCQKN